MDPGSGCGVATSCRTGPFSEPQRCLPRCGEASPRAKAGVGAGDDCILDESERGSLVGSESVVRGRRRKPGPKGATVVVFSLDGAGDDGHVDVGAGVVEAGPEAEVALGPTAEFRVGVAAGVGVEEGGRVVVGRDGELVVEVPAGVVEGTGVGTLWEVGGREAAAEEVLELVDFGGKPR